jgi:sec-independent protein translocase protein TatB
MFDIGFSELLVIGVVALIVIGPERLPRVARTAGHLYGRFQRYVSDVKMDINREMHLDELRKMQDELKTSVNSLEQSVHSELSQGAQAVQEVTEKIHEIIEIPHQSAVAESVSAPSPEPVASADETSVIPVEKKA